MNTTIEVTSSRQPKTVASPSGIPLTRIALLKLSRDVCRTFLKEDRIQTALSACCERIGRTLSLFSVSVRVVIDGRDPLLVTHVSEEMAERSLATDPFDDYELSVPIPCEDEIAATLTVTGALPKRDGLETFLEEIAKEIGGCLRHAMIRAEASARIREESALKPSSLIGIIGLDRKHHVTTWNSGCREILGWRSGDVLGRELSAVLGAGAYSRLQGYLQTALDGLHTNPCRIFVRRWDGREVPTSMEVLPFENAFDDRVEFRLVVRDESHSSQWMRLNKIYASISNILEGFTSIDIVAEPILREICSGMGWLHGEFWQSTQPEEGWTAIGQWNDPQLSADEKLTAVIDGIDDGLPEIVRQKCKVIRIRNLAANSLKPAKSSAAQLGLHEAVGVPILLEGNVVCTMLFFGFEMPQPDDALSDTLQAIASQIAMLLKKEQFDKNLREAEQNLLQSQKLEAVGLLAGGVAHDFNNLLTVILGSSEIALEMLDESSPAVGMVREIENAGLRAVDLTRQLLAFSRKQPLESAVFNVNTRIRKSEKMLKRLIDERIELRMNLEDPIHLIKFDPVQFEQVLMNLVANARDAIEGKGCISITTKNQALSAAASRNYCGGQPGDYVVVTVSDTGCGMDETTLARVFEPFFTTKELGKGTGMGLATVYGIVNQSGGFLAIESRQGAGTEISVYLSRTHEVPKTLQVDSKSTVRTAGSESVLLVEDEEVLLSLTAKMLEARGYSVLQTCSGEEALQLLKQNRVRVDLLVTDVMMPGMTGPELVSKLRSAGCEFPVLYISGYDQALSGTLDATTAAYSLLRKPFTSETLAVAVRKILDSEEILSIVD